MAETPNADRLMVMMNDPLYRDIIENVLIGHIKMNWTDDDPTFEVTDEGLAHAKALLNIPTEKDLSDGK